MLLAVVRSAATLPGHRRGQRPRNKGIRYPAAPPTVEEIVAVMRQADETIYGVRARGFIVVLWRAGLRISEALALSETDLDSSRGSVLVRRGKADVVERSAWIRGDGSSYIRGSKPASPCQWARCSA